MNIPRMEFRVGSIKEIFDHLHFFLNPKAGKWDWSKQIYKHYPDLETKIQKVKDKKERKAVEYQFFTEELANKKQELEIQKELFQKEWDKLNNEVMLALSKVLEQDWPEKDKLMIARLSLSPICPRYIKQRIFDVFYKEKEYMKGVTIHELLHFIYFEKWKKVFPKTKEKEFNSPHLVWKLSEMVPEILLNDKRIQEVFKYHFKSYKEYRKFKLNNKPLLEYLQEFYNERRDFSDFLIKSWDFINKHKKEIN